MELNNDLITQFAKITKFNTGKSATTVRGTIRESENRTYIQLDGADESSMTPVETVVEVSDGDRVIATVKDHSVIVTGNKSDPSVGVKTADGLRSSITQTAEEIRLEVSDAVKGLNSTISQTAGQIRLEVNDEVNKLSSSITQTAGQIRSEVNDEIAGVKSSITQTANTINTRIDNLNAIDGEEFTEFKQTIEGFYFTDEDGTVYIDGGSIYAKNLELTGSISWSDLSSSAKNTINGVADEAYDLAEEAKNKANDAYSLAESAMSAAEASSLPDYIQETYIDATTVQSPTIIGGTFYAVGSDPDENSTFTKMDENGFYLFNEDVEANVDNTIDPKISLICADSDNSEPMIIMGAGDSTTYQYHNRFVITKTSRCVYMDYIFNYSYDGSGLAFNRDGTIEVSGELRGSRGLFPIGYVYISFDDTSPASLFGGDWERLSGYFLYATGSDSAIEDTGYVVTEGGTNQAYYIKVAAWRRTA